MKYLLFFNLILPLLAAQCTKPPAGDDVVIQPDPKDTLKPPVKVFKDTFFVRNNGVLWNPTTQGVLNAPERGKHFTIKSIRRASNSVEEYFYISDIPVGAGFHRIEYTKAPKDINNGIPQVFFDYIVDSDQVAATYQTDTTRFDEQYLKVIAYDSVTQIIEGNFVVLMRRRSYGNGVTGIPDTISMRDGYFKLKLKPW